MPPTGHRRVWCATSVSDGRYGILGVRLFAMAMTDTQWAAAFLGAHPVDGGDLEYSSGYGLTWRVAADDLSSLRDAHHRGARASSHPSRSFPPVGGTTWLRVQVGCPTGTVSVEWCSYMRCWVPCRSVEWLEGDLWMVAAAVTAACRGGATLVRKILEAVATAVHRTLL